MVGNFIEGLFGVTLSLAAFELMIRLVAITRAGCKSRRKLTFADTSKDYLYAPVEEKRMRLWSYHTRKLAAIIVPG